MSSTHDHTVNPCGASKGDTYSRGAHTDVYVFVYVYMCTSIKIDLDIDRKRHRNRYTA